METAVIKIQHPDDPFEFADHEYEVDWPPKDCIIKLFSRGVIAKGSLAATREEGHQGFPASPYRITSVRSLPHGYLLNY